MVQSFLLPYRPPQKRLYNDEFEGSLVPHSLAKQTYPLNTVYLQWSYEEIGTLLSSENLRLTW